MKKMTAGIVILSILVAPLFAKENVDRLKRKLNLIVPTLTGWCSAEKSNALLDLVLEMKPNVCVEIGVFGGASLIPVALGLKHLGQGIVYGIDAWNNAVCVRYLDPIVDKEHVDWWSKIDLWAVHYAFLDKLLMYDLEDFCKILHKTSDQAATDIEHIDILHIDGHRSAEQSINDIHLYAPKVVQGGYICVGDASSFYKQEAIALLLQQCEVVKMLDNGNCLFFKKK